MRMTDMPDEKEWWEDITVDSMDDSEISKIAAELANHALKRAMPRILAEAVSRRDAEILKKLEGMKEFGPGGHGTCCVCQGCRQYNDECTCERNRILDELIKAIKGEK